MCLVGLRAELQISSLLQYLFDYETTVRSSYDVTMDKPMSPSTDKNF